MRKARGYGFFEVSIPDRDFSGFPVKPSQTRLKIRARLFQSLIGILVDFQLSSLGYEIKIEKFQSLIGILVDFQSGAALQAR